VILRLVDLERQYRSIQEEVDSALLDVVASTQYILGDEVDRFEDEFASYSEVRYSVGVASGTAAIHLALEALGIGEGHEVIVPANTYIGTVLPVIRVGARPVLVDCEDATATLDVEQAAAAVTSRTRALLAVHLYGHPADIDPLHDLCTKHGIELLEDACQAHGARYKGRRVGSLSRIAAFSFYPGKNLGAFGDGGAVTTADPELAERIRLLRDFGQSQKSVHAVLGWNERLDSIQAAVLRVKLRHLDRWNSLRRRHAAAYEHALSGTGIQTPKTAPWAEHVWHLYVVRTARRDALRSALAASDVETGMHYRQPLHLQPALRYLGYERGDFPKTEAWADELLSLPLFPELDSEEIGRVADIAATFEAAS
jgi:dTDP-4-amino-4,6-dideoxygalactose transaminase